MLLALDDTDDPQGGCTTDTALQLVERLGLHLRSMPRLVRLNPNCPHKTRGNGAVVLDLATPEGPRVQVGERGRSIEAFPDGGEPQIDLEDVWEAVQALARPGADPVVALAPEPLPEPVYWQAVRTRVERDEAAAVLEASGASWRGDGQGIVGCAGALAWSGPASSYELIAYRDPNVARTVDPAPLLALDDVTFHTAEAGRLVCVPKTPSPVLLGLRGHDPEALRDRGVPAIRRAGPMQGWCLWATNQASGDHVLPVDGLAEAPPWATIRIALEITEAPTMGPGGHASVEGQAPDGPVILRAFEPTGDFRRAVQALHVGDRVEATGALQGESIHLESLRLVAPVPEKTANPRCCDKSMKSQGRTGYRCAKCGATAGPEAATFRAREPGAWEVPVSARRHLHRPQAW